MKGKNMSKNKGDVEENYGEIMEVEESARSFPPTKDTPPHPENVKAPKDSENTEEVEVEVNLNNLVE